ncbi:MAG TPA: helix-turn-helix domain-containing protein [Blastocatellia bacterium]|nr:helix-turn-helix domain-containing protein [Blastocatellia bacterium]
MSRTMPTLSSDGRGTPGVNGDHLYQDSAGEDCAMRDRRSPLANLVASHLRSKGLRQVDFCRQAGFDQGLLSKILSSVVNTLNVESALKLSEGLGLPPETVFEAIGKKEVHEMLQRMYSDGGSGSGR